MKSYTDLDQSKKLAELLPLESADAFYMMGDEPVDIAVIYGFVTYKHLKEQVAYKRAVPCWSPAALLDVLESEIDGEEGETYNLKIEKEGTWWNVWYEEQYDEANPIETESTENLVDACYEIILKLHELNLL